MTAHEHMIDINIPVYQNIIICTTDSNFIKISVLMLQCNYIMDKNELCVVCTCIYSFFWSMFAAYMVCCMYWKQVCAVLFSVANLVSFSIYSVFSISIFAIFSYKRNRFLLCSFVTNPLFCWYIYMYINKAYYLLCFQY